MRLKEPRLEPLPVEELDPEIRERLGDGPVLNIFRTLAHHPKLLKRWLVFGSHVLGRSTLSPRDREILILRVGWLCRAEYEWSQHVGIGRAAGLADPEIERIAEGPDAPGWSDRERALLRAADELHADAFVGDATWSELADHYDPQQLLDLLFTVGQYRLVSMALNSLGVQLEPGAPRFPQR
jgi:alkylhydroperoxidase family enzyme